MNISMLKAKIHRAKVTQAELEYVGSITIDSALLEASGIREYEHVHVVNNNNGARIETYTIAGERNSGVICLNGAAARHFAPGDNVIIMAYCTLSSEEADIHKPTVVFVDESNEISEIGHYERHGEIK